MTTHIRHSGEFCTTGITLGDVKSVTPHTGQDHVAQVSVRFAHGVLELSTVELDRPLSLALAASVFVKGQL